VISLLRALLEERADLSAPSLRRLPEELTERMAARTRSVDPGSRAVLELLAVFERPLPVADLLVLTGLQLDQLDPILAGLVDGRAIAEGERGRELSYEVSHPLLREVVYQEISGTRKRVLHRQVARSLLDSGWLAEAALHFARSAEPGGDEAVRDLLDDMRQAEQREAFRETLDLLSELADILPATDERWLGVLETMYWQAEWVVDHRVETQAETAIRALRAIGGLLARSARAAPTTMPMLPPLVTGDDVEPHTLPAGVPCTHARRSSVAGHENFRRPWYVLRDSAAGSVHEICRWAGAVTGAPGLRGAGGNA
jgi:hypothetical protein